MTTDQKEKRNDEYNKYVKRVTPTHCLSANMLGIYTRRNHMHYRTAHSKSLHTILWVKQRRGLGLVQHDFNSHKLHTDSAKPVCTTRKLGRRRRSRSYNRLCKRSMLIRM